MCKGGASDRQRMLRVVFLCLLLLIVSGMEETAAEPQAASAPAASSDKASPQSSSRGLPLTFERHTGDLDAMVKRGNIRALVLYSRSGFFYVNGKPGGIYYEALQYFERFVNQQLHTRKHVQVTYSPVRPDQIEAALTQGVGDLIAYGLVETSTREQQVAFSIPIQTDVKQIIVTGRDFGPVSLLEDLGGKKIFVNPLTTYYQNLEKVNDSLARLSRPIGSRARYSRTAPVIQEESSAHPITWLPSSRSGNETRNALIP